MNKKSCFCIYLLLFTAFLSGCLQNEPETTESNQNLTNLSQEGRETGENLTNLTQKEPYLENESNTLKPVTDMRGEAVWTINEPVGNPEEIYCTNNETGQKTSLATAIKRANNSDCTKFAGPLNGTYSCEGLFGTWRLDLDIKQNEWCYTRCDVYNDLNTLLNTNCLIGSPMELLQEYDACEDEGKIYYIRDALAKAKNSICTEWGNLSTFGSGGCSGSIINSSTFVQYTFDITPNERHKGSRFIFCIVDLKEDKIWVFYINGTKCYRWDGTNNTEEECIVSDEQI